VTARPPIAAPAASLRHAVCPFAVGVRLKDRAHKVTISTENIVESREFRASVGANWTFLSDAGRKVQKDLDIQEYTDSLHDPMSPHAHAQARLVIHVLTTATLRRTVR